MTSDRGAAARERRNRISREVARVSPEGAPAHAWFGVRWTAGVLIGLGLLVIAGAITVGILMSPIAGVLLGLMGLLLLVWNPMVWTLVLRARERSWAERRASSQERVDASKPFTKAGET